MAGTTGGRGVCMFGFVFKCGVSFLDSKAKACNQKW